jgi:hypothetical protein
VWPEIPVFFLWQFCYNHAFNAKKSELTVKEIIQFKKPKLIPVFDAPPLLGGKKTMMTPAEVGELTGCQFTESIYVPEGTKMKPLKTLKAGFKPRREFDNAGVLRQLETLSTTPNNKLALAKMDDQMGYGVFALEAIEPGEVVAIYAGDLHFDITPDLAESDYLISVRRGVDDPRKAASVDARHRRGMAGFIQHAPVWHDRDERAQSVSYQDSEFLSRLMGLDRAIIERQSRMHPESISRQKTDGIAAKEYERIRLTDTELDDIDWHLDQTDFGSTGAFLKTLCTANVYHEEVWYNDRPLVVLVARHRIEPMEMLGMTYTLAYWIDAQLTPELVSRWGQNVPHAFYHRERNLSLFLASVNGLQRAVRDSRPAFEKDIVQRSPVPCSDDFVVSAYAIRDALVRANAKSPEFGRLGYNNTFSERFKEKMEKASGVSVSLASFWSNTLAHPADKVEGRHAEAVYTANNAADFKRLSGFFDGLTGGASLADRIERHEESRECVVKRVNDPDASLRALLSSS